MKRWKFAVIIGVALLMPIGAMLGMLMPDYMWGSKGTLTVTLSLDSTSMNTTGSINYTVVLKNTGDTKLRLFNGDWPEIKIVDSQNRRVRYDSGRYEFAPYKRPDDQQFNTMLRTMNPGDNLTRSGSITAYNPRVRVGWEILADQTYRVVGSFCSDEHRLFPAYPIWEGEVLSEPKYFMVVL